MQIQTQWIWVGPEILLFYIFSILEDSEASSIKKTLFHLLCLKAHIMAIKHRHLSVVCWPPFRVVRRNMYVPNILK